MKSSVGLRGRIVALLALGLAACHASKASRNGDAQGVLKVASQKGSTRALLEASGALQGAPYRVEWSEFGAAAPLLEALADGAVDVGAVGDAPFIFAYAAGAPVQAIFAYRSGTPRASSVAVIVPPGSPIRGPQDLRGRKVATVKGSVGHYLLIRTLEKNGVEPKSVETVFLDPGSSRGALSSGAVDAWSTWSPYVGYGLLHDHDRKVADGLGVMSGIGFMAANRASIRSKAEALQDFDRRLATAYVWGERHPEEYARRIASETGLPLDVAMDMAQRLSARPTRLDAALFKDETATLNAYRRAGVITAAPDLHGAFAQQFNRSIPDGAAP